ncbi:hypothetical protein [Streptomyces olivochromogenes]|uniref:hypothetical protein n=1 Tax=Streptomyces olivochromogenes TaxID=1963 RepID=UPI001F190319|nr:hypothetical protein [Streptomyces olivochromogenes]MCF3131708.1 hypothetical protein [Streptomyces olivochromogenes]
MATEEFVTGEENSTAPSGTGQPEPSPQAVDEAEAARKELAARGLEAWAVTKWWGFEFHLNSEAADVAGQIASLVGAVAGEILPQPFGRVVEAYCELKERWISEVDRGHGVKLVSPWIAPGMLIPIGKGPGEDPRLWWTVFEPRSGWNEDQKFRAHVSASNPALAELDGRLYCVHRGAGDERLWWMTYDPDKGWSEDRQFPAHASSDGPAVAKFGGKLHVVHRGGNGDTSLWHTFSSDGTAWSRDERLPGHHSSRGPALAEFGGELHLVHRGAGSDQRLYHATYNGSSWSPDTQLPGHMSAANPAMAEFGGKLHLVHRGSDNDARLWHATYDGSSWSTDTALPAHHSLEGPALTVFDSKLYCVHRGYGGGDQNLYWATCSGTSWSSDQLFPGHNSAAGPAAVAFRDPRGTKNQLLVVHRGYGLQAAGTDTAAMEELTASEQAAAGESGATA